MSEEITKRLITRRAKAKSSLAIIPLLNELNTVQDEIKELNKDKHGAFESTSFSFAYTYSTARRERHPARTKRIRFRKRKTSCRNSTAVTIGGQFSKHSILDSIINKNPTLNNIQSLFYLLISLKDEAAQVISYFSRVFDPLVL